MTSSHFCLSSKTYKNNVFEGFSRLQQSDEFVDMTLAAEGHLVKVHQTLIALASPYLKEMLRSVPCQHPVLFLNNVSHEVLCFILEYIYTGEVNIPSEKVKTFLNVAQSMHISGLINIIPPSDNKFSKKEEATHVSLNAGCGPPGVKACITINENDFNLQVQPNAESSNNEAENVQTGTVTLTSNLPASEENNQLLRLIDVNNGTFNNSVAINIHGNNTGYGRSTQETMSNMDTSNTVNVNSGTIPIPMIIGGQLQQLYAKPLLDTVNEETINAQNLSNNNETSVYPTDFSNLFNIASKIPVPQTHNLPVDINITELLDCNKVATPSTTHEVIEVADNQEQSDAQINKDPDSVLYTISNRGSLQLIMNRFMYYTHYQTNGGRKRRWRCIEYRNSHCLAAFDMNDGVIVSRKCKHTHPNHDKKIWQKVMQNKIFNTIKMAEDVMEKKQKIPEPVVLSDSENSENK